MGQMCHDKISLALVRVGLGFLRSFHGPQGLTHLGDLGVLGLLDLRHSQLPGLVLEVNAIMFLHPFTPLTQRRYVAVVAVPGAVDAHASFASALLARASCLGVSFAIGAPGPAWLRNGNTAHYR